MAKHSIWLDETFLKRPPSKEVPANGSDSQILCAPEREIDGQFRGSTESYARDASTNGMYAQVIEAGERFDEPRRTSIKLLTGQIMRGNEAKDNKFERKDCKSN